MKDYKQLVADLRENTTLAAAKDICSTCEHMDLVIEEPPTNLDRIRAIDIGISAIQDKIDSLCEQEDKP